MSAIASFYLLSQEDFDAYCKLAHLAPYNEQRAKKRGWLVPSAVPPAETQTPEYQKLKARWTESGDYLRKHSKEPFEYQWSGYVMSELMDWLQETKHICLIENTWEDEDMPGYSSILFNKTTKEKYLAQVDPSKYKPADLAYSFCVFSEEKTDALLKTLSTRLSKKQFEQSAELHKELLQSRTTEFPERGKAMLDGIKIIHQYLQLVDDNHVVLLHIG